MPRPHLDLETWGKIRRFTDSNGKPTARANYRDQTGRTRRMQRQGKTLADAERVLIRAMKAALADAEGDLSPESTVKQAGQKWFEEPSFQDFAVQTRGIYQRAFQNLIANDFGDVLLREATVPRVDRLMKRLVKDHGPSAEKSARTLLSHVFGLAVRHGAMPSNPIRELARPAGKKKAVDAPSLADIRELRWIMHMYDVTPDKRGAKRCADLCDVLDMLTATGCRPGEILALEWDDVDLDGTVAIAKTVVITDDKKLDVQEHPKTDAGRRVLTLPKYARDMLTRRRVESHSTFVFPSSTGTLRWPHNLRRQWREAVTGTPYETVTPRSIRRAVATRVRDVLGVQAAQEQLGHASSVVTQKHYIQPLAQAPDVSPALEGFAEKGE